MDVKDAIDVLKKYYVYDDAEAECKKEKVSESPYDVKGHNEIYCKYLSQKWVEFRDKLDIEYKRCSNAMKELSRAEKVLKDAIQEDYWSK